MVSVTALPRLAGKLREQNPKSTANYQRLHKAAVDGTLPGLIRQGGRLFIEDSALPAVAAMFGPKSDAPRNAA